MMIEAIQLQSFGLAVHPLRGKVPVLPSWQNRFLNGPPSEFDIKKWFRSVKNIGAVTGRASACVVIDIDSKAALQRLKAMGELPRTWAVKSRRGWHLYFNYTDEIPSCKPLEEVDFLSDGKQVVLPPSIHPSLYKYSWILAPWDAPRADLPRWFIEFVQASQKMTWVPHADKSQFGDLLDDVDWLEFYSRFVEKIRGSGEWRSGLCPFHTDHHPSYSFNICHGGWICYAGCGTGNGYQAIQRFYQVSFREALALVKGEDPYV